MISVDRKQEVHRNIPRKYKYLFTQGGREKERKMPRRENETPPRK